MRVLMCLTYEHDWPLLILATLLCIVGSCVSIKLFERTLSERGQNRIHWSFLSAIVAGSSIWTTHFISMLSYQATVPYTFDAPLTVLSVIIAIVGTGLGLTFSAGRNTAFASIVGGGMIGLSIAAMHYVGMFAYKPDGVVTWLPEYVIASIIFAVILSALMVSVLRGPPSSKRSIYAIACFTLAILSLHFTGMAAFVIQPIAGVVQGASSGAFLGMAYAVAFVGLLIIGAGVSTQFVERRTEKRSREQLHYLASHDALTGLANRRTFAETLHQMSLQFGESGEPFVLLYLDLDRFKQVNDSLGHPIGDRVLKMAAQRMRRVVRQDDLVARIGGDEFAFIIKETDEAEARQIADRLVEIIARPFVVDGQVAEIGASVGIILAPKHGSDAETLVQHADIALYTAKSDGRNRAHLFEPQLIEALERRRSLEADLRQASTRKELSVHYQPVIDTRSGKITGAEALLRWDCGERGAVPPSEFIPIAEELGLISRLGAFVLEQACADAAGWPADIDIAVNLSPIQLADPRLVQTVSQALTDSGLAPQRLELEITETAILVDDVTALRVLNEIKALGVNISLDDFGTGYSSLSYLHRFPISRIKIDRSFVQRLPEDEGSASIINAITQLGDTMNMKITAEGIETKEQFDYISQRGCDNIQGFLISVPVDSASIITLLQSNKDKEAA